MKEMMAALVLILVCVGCTAAQWNSAADTADKGKKVADKTVEIAGGPVGQVIGTLAPPAAPIIGGLNELAIGAGAILAGLAAYFRSKAAAAAKNEASAKAERNVAFDNMDGPTRKAVIEKAAAKLAGK
jgi:hypothetical protein